MSSACAAYDAAHPGFFDNVDARCGLPAGTAQTFGQIESSCSNGAATATGTYRGMFQFSSSSCPGANLNDANAQANCLCTSTSMWRNKFRAQTGRDPSAGMYYLFHQQGGCGIKLAMARNERAVDVVSQCVSSNRCNGSKGGCERSMNYAMKAIGWNLPKGSGYDASSVTAEQFANLYLAKFAGVDDSNICLISQGTNVDTSSPASLIAQAANAALNGVAPGSALAQAILGSGALTQGNSLLSAAFVELIMKGDISSMFSPLFNPRYDEDEDDKADTPAETKVTITTNSNGTKTVTVETGESKAVYTVNFGQQVWKCGGSYDVYTAIEARDLPADVCKLVAAVAAP